MSRLHTTIARALYELGELTDIDLGSGAPTPDPAREEARRRRLLERLEREAGIHKRMLLAIVGACFVLFVTGISLLYFGEGEPGAIRLVTSGGLLTGMLATLGVARRTLVDKAGYDILLTVIPALPPDQLGAVLKNLYYSRRVGK